MVRENFPFKYLAVSKKGSTFAPANEDRCPLRHYRTSRAARENKFTCSSESGGKSRPKGIKEFFEKIT